MKTNYTFQNPRYLTRGIEASVPIEVQLFIWNGIDNQVKEGKKTDYLQIITFSRNQERLIIDIHQEKPKRNTQYSIRYRENYQSLLGLKIYVIDDISHSTMLLSSDY